MKHESKIKKLLDPPSVTDIINRLYKGLNNSNDKDECNYLNYNNMQIKKIG